MGDPPREIKCGPWRMLIELTTKKTSSLTSVSEFVAKLTSSQEEELTLLEFRFTKSKLENSTTLASSGEPFVLDIDYTFRDGKQQHFNKANILVDIYSNIHLDNSWGKNLEISLRNENRPENEEFRYKLQYEMGRMTRGDHISWFDYISYVSLMESGCTGCPNRTIEKLTGNYSWSHIQNPEKFEFRSEDSFYSEAQSLGTPGSGLPFVWLGCLYEKTFGGGDYFDRLLLESGFPLFQFARMVGVESSRRNLGKPRIQLKVLRQLVYEKNTVDRFLNFYGISLETAGKLKKLEQTVMINEAMWHRLDYQVTSEHKRSLTLESAPQQIWLGDTLGFGYYGYFSTTPWPDQYSSKFMLDYKLTYGHGETLETILASAGGFIFSYKDSFAYNSPGKAAHALDIVVDFLEYPKTRGLKCLLDWKIDKARAWRTRAPPETTSVFKYLGDFVWITDREVLEKVFALETKEMIIQAEESPFYGLLGDLGLVAGQVSEANISRLFHWDKTYKTGRVTKNGAEVVKIKKRSSDLRPNHFSFDISFQLPPRQNQSSCLPDESCLEREVEVELHLPTNNFHNSLLEMNVNIGNELATKTKVKLTWEGRGQRGQFPLKYNITNEILFVGRRGHSEKERMCVDGEGELGLGLDGKGEIFDSRDGMYWVVWSGSCRGSSEKHCTYFGIPEIRNLTFLMNTSGYQDSMLHMVGRF